MSATYRARYQHRTLLLQSHRAYSNDLFWSGSPSGRLNKIHRSEGANSIINHPRGHRLVFNLGVERCEKSGRPGQSPRESLYPQKLGRSIELNLQFILCRWQILWPLKQRFTFVWDWNGLSLPSTPLHHSTITWHTCCSVLVADRGVVVLPNDNMIVRYRRWSCVSSPPVAAVYLSALFNIILANI